MQHNVYLYILISFLVCYAIRTLPLTLIRKPITNRFIRSFLYYVPYVTLAVMTFPGMIYSCGNTLAGVICFVVGVVLSYMGKPLFTVACACCATVLICQFF